MGRSQETFKKKEVRSKQEKKRKEKEKKRLARKENDKKSGLDDMIAYVDENGMITSTPPDPRKKNSANVEDIEVSIPRRDPNEDRDIERKGTVAYFDHSKGYGFIRDAETRESIFVHINNTLEEIKENNVVSYELVKGQKGPTAVNVKLYKE